MTYVQCVLIIFPRLLEKEEFKCFVLCRGICISFHIFPFVVTRLLCSDVSVWKTGNHIYAHAHRGRTQKTQAHTPRRTGPSRENWTARQLDSLIKYTRKNSARWFMQNFFFFCLDIYWIPYGLSSSSAFFSLFGRPAISPMKFPRSNQGDGFTPFKWPFNWLLNGNSILQKSTTND